MTNGYEKRTDVIKIYFTQSNKGDKETKIDLPGLSLHNSSSLLKSLRPEDYIIFIDESI